MSTFKLKQLSVAVALLAGTGAAQALEPAAFVAGFANNGGTPFTNSAGSVYSIPANPAAANPNSANIFYISGGAAQDLAFAQVIRDKLAQPGTLTIFGDATSATSTNFGARWTAYYFTGTAATGGLNGQPILVVKRSLGAAGYGVVPVIAGIPLHELLIDQLQASDLGNGFVRPEPIPATLSGIQSYYRVILTNSAATYASDTSFPTRVVQAKTSDAGILGVDAQLLLKPGTYNYPSNIAATNIGGTAFVTEPTFPTNIASVPSTWTRLYTGGQAHGVGVTTDLYKVLQAAQVLNGTLPASTTIGDYTHAANIPTLPSTLVGSLIGSKINTWDQIKVTTTAAGAAAANAILGSAIFNAAGGQTLALTDPLISQLAGVPAPGVVGPNNAIGSDDGPFKFASGAFINQVPVSIAGRNKGAAIGAVANAVFLQAPWTTNAAGLASSPTAGDVGAPHYRQAGGATATGQLLDDWNEKLNNSTLNGTSTKRWGIGFSTADQNASGAYGVNPEDAASTATGKRHYRWVRVDGALPTIANISAGRYNNWAEGELLHLNTAPADAKSVFKAIADGLSDPNVAKNVNKTVVHTWTSTSVDGGGVTHLTDGTGIFGKPRLASGALPAYTPSFPFSDDNPVVPFSHAVGSIIADETVPLTGLPASGVYLP